MQKQRIRALDILAEKENELEITKYFPFFSWVGTGLVLKSILLIFGLLLE